MDYPQYTLKPDLKRIMIPQLLKLIVLCGIFYSGIIFNLKILKIDAPIHINILVIIVLFILVLLQTILSHVKSSKLEYKFYQDRIEFNNNKIYYKEIPEIKLKQNFFDKLFDTKTIILGKFKISAITNYNEMYAYIEKLAQAVRGYYY